MAADLKGIYAAATEEAADRALTDFCQKRDSRYPMIGKSRRARWTEIVPFLSCPPDIQRVIYTPHAAESLNYSWRKISRNRLAFPTADAAMKLIYMGIENISKKWTMPIQHWQQALNYLAIKFEGRVPV